MTSKERLQRALNHKSPDFTPTDFGATAVTGIHCLVIEKLRSALTIVKKAQAIILSTEVRPSTHNPE